MPNKYIPVPKAAELLGMSRQNVYLMLDSGRLTKYELYGQIMLNADEVNKAATNRRLAAIAKNLRQTGRLPVSQPVKPSALP